jgi:hypothetical protein
VPAAVARPRRARRLARLLAAVAAGLALGSSPVPAAHAAAPGTSQTSGAADDTASDNSLLTDPVELTIHTSGPGQVTAAGLPVDPTRPYGVRPGATQTFLARPDPGAQVTSATLDGQPLTVAPDGTVTVTDITEPHTIAIVFSAITHYVTAGAGAGGAVAPSGRVGAADGSNLTVAIVPKPGYRIARVLIDGADAGPVASWTFQRLTGDHRLTATFALVVAGVKAAQTTLRLVKGRSATLRAKAYTLNAKVAKLTWSTTSRRVATVTSYGKVRARRPGRTVIRVTAGGLTAKVKVTVVAKAPAKAKNKVRAVRANVPPTLAAGEVRYVTATWRPHAATGVTAHYSSSNKAVARVDRAGRITAKSPGTTSIRVKAGAATKRYVLTVI